MKTGSLLNLLLTLLCAGCVTGAGRVGTARVQQLQDLRFGLFVCWSFSTFSGKEWTPGIDNVAFFRATECDTDQWARTAKEAGMGYILFLAKHHDGFCLWDTQTTDRKVTKAPLGRDVLANLCKSCDKYGLKLALYFSEGEWAWPGGVAGKGYGAGVGKNPAMKQAQLKELLTQYGPIEYIWFDHAVGDGGLSHADTVAFCKALQPACFIGFNSGDQADADIRLGEMGRPGPLADHSAAGPHMKNPPGKNYRLAEFTYPILPKHKGGAMWFYSLPEHDALCLDAEKIYADYLGAKKYGNVFALDVGPDYRGRLRDIDVVTLRKVGEMIRNNVELPEPIRAFCVDFNWGPGGPNGFAPPGLWADADPAEHIAWYAGLGANVIQTFAVSCNGYAWYQGGKIPAQPGLQHNFLPEVVQLGHAKGMKVMGYFCIAANTRWGREHPELSYGTPSAYHVPFTDAYLDYLAAAIEEALTRGSMDGFMVDWLWNPSDKVRNGKWLPAEKQLFEQLTGQPFPGEDHLTAEANLAYERKAIDRCWDRIHATAKRVKPACIIWLSCNKVADPAIAGSRLLQEVDWMMDESGNPDAMRAITPMLGPQARQMLCLVGWGDRHDARKVLAGAANASFGIYGFSKPVTNSLPLPIATYMSQPPDAFKGNDRNIAVLTRVFTGQPLPAAAAILTDGKTVRASSVWGRGYEADKACDGDETTRWGAAPEAHSGWLEVDLGAEKEIDRAVVMEISFPRTQKFAVEYQDGAVWKTVAGGTTIAGRRVYAFAPVKARRFRLNILEANEVPTIEEFQLLAPGAPLPEALEQAQKDEARRAARLQWFHAAKYGLFINWGLYSLPAGEWKGQPVGGIGEWIMHNARIPVKEYEQLAQQFNPVKFNADEWAQLAVDAGMKYLVFDCKHHDGFALYHSQVSQYNCFDATPWHRDPFRELQVACARRGIKFCFYYSQATDWHEPNGANNDWDFPPNAQKDFDQYFRDKSMPQVKELLTGYGPIGLIWFDVPTLMTPARCRQLVDLVRSLQPDTLINSRLGPGGLQDYQSRGDNEIPHTVTPGAWETAATINDTWGYKKDDHHWKTPEDICFKLVDIVSKGGNYLLNVGPDGAGAIPQESQDVLRKVGAWLKVNGEAIYGASRTPFGDELGSLDPVKKDKHGRPAFNISTDWRCTTQPNKLFIHFFKWPAGKFELAGVKVKVARAYLLAGRQPLPFTQDGEKIGVTLPEQAPDALATVLCLETK
jgi:alpha-L-fucosidase